MICRIYTIIGAKTVQHQSIYKCYLTGVGFYKADTITVALIGKSSNMTIGSTSYKLNKKFTGADIEFDVSAKSDKIGFSPRVFE